MNRQSGVKVGLLLAMVAFGLFEYVMHRQSGVFRGLEVVLLSLQWMLLGCIAFWCGTFLFTTFRLNDLPLIGLLLVAIVAYFVGYTTFWQKSDAVILLAGVTLGRGARVLLKADGRWQMADGRNHSEIVNRKSPIVNFLVGLVVLLAFSSWWHLDMSENFYHGPRWMGLWDNPNDYGLLMGAGLVLAVGLLAAKKRKRHKENSNSSSWRFFAAKNVSFILLVTAGMMAVGLLFSYSRGAWVGTAIGLLYLVKVFGKFKWRFVLPGILVTAAVVWFFWNATPDTAPWYVKRMDLGRPSAQHRVAAWRGAFQMMWDHPFGIGWNKAIDVYGKNYSPPENGATAITTNDYLMLGTQLGLPGLLCFVAYVALRLGIGRWKIGAGMRRPHLHLTLSPSAGSGEEIACRAGALTMLVVFWFDGGLFKLTTAAVFWILLELGALDLAVRNS